MSFYSELAATANDLLTEFGQAVVLSRKSSTYNPATGSATEVEVDQSGYAAIFDRAAKDIDGTLVQAGDKQLLLSAVGIDAPNVGDSVTLASSRTFTITAISALAPAGEVVMYEGNLR